MIRGSDGLDYEDITAKLLGEPAKTHRNEWVEYLRRRGEAPGLLQAFLDLPPGADSSACTDTLVQYKNHVGKPILTRYEEKLAFFRRPRSTGKSTLTGRSPYIAILDDLDPPAPGASA